MPNVRLDIPVDWELVPGTVRKEIICEKAPSGVSITTRWLDEAGIVLRQDVNFAVDKAAPSGSKSGRV